MLQNFFDVIFTAGGIFHYDYDRGYADSNIVTSNKFYNIVRYGQCYKTFLT